MAWLADHLVTWMAVLPLAGVVLLAFLEHPQALRRVALAFTLLDVLLSLVLWHGFDPSNPAPQFVDRVLWMPTFHVQYAVGVDGISLPLLLLTSLLSPLCVLCSWREITTHLKAFLMLILLVEASMILVFAAMDLFLFFMLWETTTIPMYFIIGLWGGRQRIQSAIKFALYSLTGSLLLLVGILALYLEGGHTFDLQELAAPHVGVEVQRWIFAALFIAFAIKTPMVPFHAWLPDAHTEAPTAGSVLLAGVFLKMGGYGFMRICLPVLPAATAAVTPLVLWLSVLGILYGAYMALAQADLKRLVAYSSISHMGFVTLGIFVANTQGLQGALLQMVNHGVTTGALFLAVGQVYERTHSRMIADYGGLLRLMPRFTVFLFVFAVASFGLPGTNNFIGEFLVLVGTATRSYPMVILAVVGILLAAAYMLWMVQRVAMGPAHQVGHGPLPDLDRREMAILLPLIVLVFWVGLYPRPVLGLMEASITLLVEHLPVASSG
ncbi:complex I subunit 4 family protein [Nitrospira sp. Kam-Ns4a]